MAFSRGEIVPRFFSKEFLISKSALLELSTRNLFLLTQMSFSFQTKYSKYLTYFYLMSVFLCTSYLQTISLVYFQPCLWETNTSIRIQLGKVTHITFQELEQFSPKKQLNTMDPNFGTNSPVKSSLALRFMYLKISWNVSYYRNIIREPLTIAACFSNIYWNVELTFTHWRSGRWRYIDIIFFPQFKSVKTVDAHQTRHGTFNHSWICNVMFCRNWMFNFACIYSFKNSKSILKDALQFRGTSFHLQALLLAGSYIFHNYFVSGIIS